MSRVRLAPPAGQQAAFGALLTEAVGGVVQAQRRLDEDALARVAQFVSTPQGELALPPLWYTFSDIRLTLEMAATVTRLELRTAQSASPASQEVRLDCRMLNPAAVSLFGYTASSGLKVELRVAPKDAGGLRPEDATPAPSPARVNP
jgi:hypothetical protein